MATQGLFMNPEDVGDARLMQLAQMDPNQRLFLQAARSGQQLGQGIGSLFGQDVRDPAVVRATKMRELAAKYGTTTAEGLDKIAMELQASDPQMAMQVKMQADELRMQSAKLTTQQAQTSKLAAEEVKITQASALEERLRKELAALGPEATEQDIMDVVVKFGPADKVMSVLQTAQNKKADIASRESMQKERLEEQARRDRERAQERKDLAVLVASLKQGQGAKPLSGADLKEINKLTNNVDTAQNTIDQADKFIKKIDDGQMVFGAGENALGVVRRIAGKSNESDLNKVEFEQFVTGAVNSILNLAKGPQTDLDAKRAEKQIIDALNKNDSKAVKRGLESLKRVWEDAKKTDMSALELYSSERGGKAFTPSSQTSRTPETPAVTPKPTKRFNPTTGQIENI